MSENENDRFGQSGTNPSFGARSTSQDKRDNLLDGRDDPNRGPLDRAGNALDGHDDPNRGPLDRSTNALSGSSGAMGAGSTATSSRTSGGTTASAVFDSHEEAERAVMALRTAGISNSALSVIEQQRGKTTTTSGDGEVTDEQHSNLLRGILGGGALGAGLGVLALAIPGVGPLAAAGAIAASAAPEAVAIGAVAGAAAGSLNEMLGKHGVSDEDAAYYSDRIKSGGVFVSVDTSHGNLDAQNVRDILYRHGGHSASQSKMSS